jgi:hypothetical protein
VDHFLNYPLPSLTLQSVDWPDQLFFRTVLLVLSIVVVAILWLLFITVFSRHGEFFKHEGTTITLMVEIEVIAVEPKPTDTLMDSLPVPIGDASIFELYRHLSMN